MVRGNLSALLRKGGIYYRLPGKFPKETLSSFVDIVPATAPAAAGQNAAVNRDKLLQALLEREELMPTAMGNGIALPHPRNPIIEKEEDQFAALAFPENEIDWGALDGKPIHTIILIVSASAKTHLASLQRISFFCRDENFSALLKRRAPAEEIIGYIENIEQGWE